MRYYGGVGLQHWDKLAFGMAGKTPFTTKSLFIENLMWNHRWCAVEGAARIVLFQSSGSLGVLRLQIGERPLRTTKHSRFDGKRGNLRRSSSLQREWLFFRTQTFANYDDGRQEQ